MKIGLPKYIGVKLMKNKSPETYKKIELLLKEGFNQGYSEIDVNAEELTMNISITVKMPKSRKFLADQLLSGKDLDL